MQVAQKVVKLTRVCMVSTLFLVLSVSAQANLPTATMDDYVWKTLDPIRGSGYFKNECEYDSLPSYKKCLGESLDKHDNELSKKWGLSDRVTREKDTVYIQVPNRSLPLVFRDELFAPNAQSHSYFSLYDYDKKRQLLYLLRSFPEGEGIILVNLRTGFSQEFDGIDLNVSPDQSYVTTVDRYIGEENITIWQKQKKGDYKIVYESNLSELKAHLDFYQNRDQRHDLEDIDIEWEDKDSVLVDFYYLINGTDDIGYRVRFNYVKTEPTSDWQMIPIK